jgi:hypothetical protein
MNRYGAAVFIGERRKQIKISSQFVLKNEHSQKRIVFKYMTFLLDVSVYMANFRDVVNKGKRSYG